MKVLVIGATGGIGSRLLPMLIGNGHEVVGLHRKPGQASAIEQAGGQAVLGDIITMSVDDLAQAASGCDAIVFSAGAAGSGPDRTTAIDGDGPIKAVEAARAAGVSRFYLVSAFPEAGRGGEPKPGFEHYMAEKKRADVAVAASELGWVILRPGKLLDEAGAGRVALGAALPYGSVSRDSVAQVLAALLETPAVTGEILELTDGEVAVDDAVSRLVR
ncbi:SDR family oxidoreductase [Salinicola halophilus]|uniref:SDR family oxidoreductase n=1 Tax=Salinicola halophilus TaxID=184065 RepID=UPI000DA1539C|nr:SDR family oxidoreductase [Salinicola halophilus]